jgi:hypothetical protein
MSKRRWWIWLLVLMVLMPITCVGRAVYNVPINRWRATQQFQSHREMFAAVVAEFKDKGFQRLTMQSGGIVAKCGIEQCPSLSNGALTILRDMHFDSIHRTGNDVYFVKDSGFQYEMGIAYFDQAPRVLKNTVRPAFEYELIEGA